MEFPYKIDVKTEDETLQVALEFAEVLATSDIIALNGNLGAGKTFFVKSICSKFKIKNVTSPSFAIVNEYSGSKKIYHFDFYRIKRNIELYDIGFEDYINDPGAIVFIEWADMMNEMLPAKRYDVNIDIKDENKREITITKHE